MSRRAGFALAASALLSACATPREAAMPAAVPVPITTAQQWLFGSAESAVVARQAFRELTEFALAARGAGRSVVLADGASPAAPRFTDCAAKPPAVVFDADETLIWNLGSARWMAERGIAFDPKLWAEWERTGAGKARALPGAIEAVRALRAAGIAVIANTNRETANAAGTEATLAAAGLGAFRHGDTLFLKGDDATGSSKDARRAAIAARYCVVAMAGDQLGDFAQMFNDKALTSAARRELATAGPIADLWGRGWFMIPNPTYGPWDRIGYDDAFPADTEWAPAG